MYCMNILNVGLSFANLKNGRMAATKTKALLVSMILALSLLAAIPILAQASNAASADLSQCVNGGVGGLPDSKEPCLTGTLNSVSYSNWVNGNANGQKAHWREGDFIAYRSVIVDTAGTHTLEFSYDTVHSGGHALDYIGSVNATETFSTTSSMFYYNNNNPCGDVLPASQCTPASPVSSVAAPHENFGPGTGGEQGCGGSSGTFTGTQIPGKILLYGPAGSSLTSATIVSDNVPSGNGQCYTTVSVVFTIGGSGSQMVVMAWGGHIASELNWGTGNGASTVNGSPYHMSLVSLDGASVGSQDRALSTSAIFYAPTVSTQVYTSSDIAVPLGTELPNGTSVHDTATLTNASDVAGGTVNYILYNTGSVIPTGACNGTVLSNQTVSVTNSIVPNSTTVTEPKGNYGYNVTYSGDTGKHTLPTVLSACETFTIASPLGISTQVNTSSITFSTNNTNPEFHDLASITGGASPVTGALNFTLYFGATPSLANASCQSGTGFVFSSVVSVSGDGNYSSGSYSPLAAGTYYWVAYFNSTNSDNPSVSTDCGASGEVVTVSKASPSIRTSASPTITLGQNATDVAILSGVTSNASGKIFFTVFSSLSACQSGTGAVFNTAVNVTGSGNYSALFKPSSIGTYYWNATYTGDSKNSPALGVCGASGETTVVSSIPKITFFGYTNSPQNEDPTLGNGTAVYTFNITNFGTEAVNLSGSVSLVVSGDALVTVNCSTLQSSGLSAQGTLAAGQTATYSESCSYAGSSGGVVSASLTATFKDVNGVSGLQISGAPAKIDFTVETT